MLKGKRLWIALGVGMLAALGGAIAYVGKVMKSLAPEPRFARVALRDVTMKVSATGTIEADQQVVVKSKVAGRVVDLMVDEGDLVRAGQVIAHIDPLEIRRQQNQVQADIAAAQARLTQAGLNKSLGDRTLQSQLDRARAELAASQADNDKTRAGARKEELARSEAALAQAKSRLDDAEATLRRQRDWWQRGFARKQAEADLEAAQATLARWRAGARPQEIAVTQAAADRATINCEEARRVAERKKRLRAEGFASDADVDLADTQYKASAQDLKSAKEQLALLKAGSRPEDIRQSEAQVERAQRVLEQARENEKQGLESAQAQYDIARHAHESAQQDLALLRAGARPEELRSAESQVRRAEAALREALARMDQSKVNNEDIIAARAQVTRLLETLGNVSTQLEDTIVRAPISGVVTQRALRQGELVTSGISSFTAGMQICTIADLSSLIVRVPANEVDVAKLYRTQKAAVSVAAIPDATFNGRIRKIAPASLRNQQTAGQQQTQQQPNQSDIVWFDLEILLPHADRRLKPGMTANIDIVTASHKQAPCLAREALTTKDKKRYADKVTAPEVIAELNRREREKGDDDEARPQNKKLHLTAALAKAKKTEVNVGLRDDQWAHVKSGLQLGDWALIRSAEPRRTFEIGEGRRGER